ncbi:hypothetical protein [Paenibacillus sp. Leaf72]|uniref:hypothetical protein n=1 Tax=Paenibacillus sp. Leaf72 TaxID=1736234 RepID=UPI00070082E7|nr:hypothetical protein [Paenibacillus sp. Leaf72]KQN96818.1 hypothetical protein ASF12_22360 [Paenibacillus sp. Leaf72]
MGFPNEMSFESCYPIEVSYYSEFRIGLVSPHVVMEIKNGNYHVIPDVSLTELLQPHLSIDMYSFLICEDVLLEQLYLGSVCIHLYSRFKNDEKEEFISKMFSLFHVVLYGDINMPEDVIARDDFCVQLKDTLKISEPFTISFDDGINHFFLRGSSNDWIDNDYLALGGGPSTIFGLKKSRSPRSNLYLMKAMKDWSSQKAILNRDSWLAMSKVTDQEMDIASFIKEQLRQSQLQYNIYHTI